MGEEVSKVTALLPGVRVVYKIVLEASKNICKLANFCSILDCLLRQIRKHFFDIEKKHHFLAPAVSRIVSLECKFNFTVFVFRTIHTNAKQIALLTKG